MAQEEKPKTVPVPEPLRKTFKWLGEVADPKEKAALASKKSTFADFVTPRKLFALAKRLVTRSTKKKQAEEKYEEVRDVFAAVYALSENGETPSLHGVNVFPQFTYAFDEAALRAKLPIALLEKVTDQVPVINAVKVCQLVNDGLLKKEDIAEFLVVEATINVRPPKEVVA